MASVTEVKSPEKAAAWTKALIFGVPTEYGRKRSSQDARWLKYRGDITLNNLSTAVLQAAMVCTCIYMSQFLCIFDFYSHNCEEFPTLVIDITYTYTCR